MFIKLWAHLAPFSKWRFLIPGAAFPASLAARARACGLSSGNQTQDVSLDARRCCAEFLLARMLRDRCIIVKGGCGLSWLILCPASGVWAELPEPSGQSNSISTVGVWWCNLASLLMGKPVSLIFWPSRRSWKRLSIPPLPLFLLKLAWIGFFCQSDR